MHTLILPLTYCSHLRKGCTTRRKMKRILWVLWQTCSSESQHSRYMWYQNCQMHVCACVCVCTRGFKKTQLITCSYAITHRLSNIVVFSFSFSHVSMGYSFLASLNLKSVNHVLHTFLRWFCWLRCVLWDLKFRVAFWCVMNSIYRILRKWFETIRFNMGFIFKFLKCIYAKLIYLME